MTNLWSAKTRIGLLRCQARCHRRRLNLASVFCLFCIVHFFWLVSVCVSCVRFSLSIPSQEIGREEHIWPILWQVGHKTLTRSINVACLRGMDKFFYKAGSFRSFRWYTGQLALNVTALKLSQVELTRCVVSCRQMLLLVATPAESYDIPNMISYLTSSSIELFHCWLVWHQVVSKADPSLASLHSPSHSLWFIATSCQYMHIVQSAVANYAFFSFQAFAKYQLNAWKNVCRHRVSCSGK